jgi:glucan-binding YG repeat protein
MSSSGAMVSGWQKVGDKWYYFDNNGAMQTGWLKDGKYWYFLHPETGAMMTGKIIINNEKYLFNDSGVWIGTFE